MSSLAIDMYPVGVPAIGFGGGPQRGGHLRLVRVGDRSVTRAHAQTSARITRRGRLALTGTVAFVLVLAFASLLNALGPAGASSGVVVEPGMTLSQVAAEQLPDLPLSQAITDLQRANKLSTTSIAVGQELIIPGR
ncbi:MAG: LysM peptidoglycan-binding domain-containing protein [Ornithinimicrobium sp.]|uniref:LysM peptidoglycan-binding domain-containing protein n=1 Tax=Ornithinimicrobium sp. TaxID=1977084 RepID=UPI0026DF7EF9|nr:LysM peptidoglycan-binding domain-containing protein [Ornithinimicrobium sp.]MDO5741150.1 LysM peptidoglycan-binding domain-containing protein [Ornithinimicrobium sp.]